MCLLQKCASVSNSLRFIVIKLLRSLITERRNIFSKYNCSIFNLNSTTNAIQFRMIKFLMKIHFPYWENTRSREDCTEEI